MKKFFLTALVALTMGSMAFAQEEATMTRPGSHITVGARVSAGGLLLHDDISKPTKLGFGMGGDLSYAYFFNNTVGIRTGIYGSLTNSAYVNTNIHSDATCMVTYTGLSTPHIAEYNADTKNVREDYSSAYVEIPVQLALQGNHWYANLGVKCAVPVRVAGNYRYDATEVFFIGSHATDNSSFIGGVSSPVWDATLPQTSGSYSINNFRADNNYVNPFFVMGALEAGYRFGCDCGHSWQIGAFVDFAINSIATPDNADLIYSTNGGVHHFTNGVMHTSLVDSFRFVNFGLKLSYDFALRK